MSGTKATPLSRRALLWVPLGVAAAGGVGFWAMLRGMRDGSYDPRGVPSALIGKPAPRIALPAVEGIDLPAFAPDALAAPAAPVLVNFWASWCVPCVVEHPQLMALHRRGVRILGINYKDKPADAARFLARHGNPFAALVADAEGRAGIEYGLYGVPETYLLDKGGLIRWRWAGPMMPDTLSAELDPLLRRHA
ncbi:cytochrome c biogenesis protein CcmG, thiol:disulfide interchange protein DsbE [Roseomonas rosea]|jgi:cytochrome c biogenesis protein CcmG/thiol:disulfide interchange protein DsbE|uniref:Cytochrome c biogenesis protein CcmG, thiol:disulfide interchange protein DsbE n=1 Tax=Muricoccus roseus TaxID=198092 RepID=A0A1M6H325_9PROT|nr:DsbE family thiol:disulfide interchange protein [Roseomonas rosea]SHJ16574.1 cytochrome c biogenesis protein CcmG, thiol:disulfide interchange protein DsbE [Roseomonas rosea]